MRKEVARTQEQLAEDRIRREHQFADIRLGAARSREDVGLGLRRRLEDTLIDESGFGGLGIGQAVGLESQLTAAIEGAGAGDFISNLEQNVADVLGDFSSTFLNRPSFSDEDIAEFERFALDQARALQDIDREAGRAEANLLSEIASEEANNQWKTDIAIIAANTPLTQITDTEFQAPLETSATEAAIESPAIQETMLNATKVMLTVENLEIAALDSSAILMHDAALAHMRAAGDHSNAAAAHVSAAKEWQGLPNAIVAQIAAALQRIRPPSGSGAVSITREDALAIGDIIAEGVQSGEIVGIGGGD